MKMNDIAVIFDIDGLMVDTEPLSRRAWDQVLAEYGVTVDDNTHKRIIGFRINETTDYLIEKYGLSADPETIIQDKRAAYDLILAQGIPVMPGLFDLVAAVEKRGISWGVATSSPYAHAHNVLSQIGLWERCQSVTGGDEVRQGKPAPDIYLLAAQRMGYAPARCLALEDSAPGCRAALAAGLLTIAIPNGDTIIEDLPAVDYRCPSLSEVVDRLDDLILELQSR